MAHHEACCPSIEGREGIEDGPSIPLSTWRVMEGMQGAEEGNMYLNLSYLDYRPRGQRSIREGLRTFPERNDILPSLWLPTLDENTHWGPPVSNKIRWRLMIRKDSSLLTPQSCLWSHGGCLELLEAPESHPGECHRNNHNREARSVFPGPHSTARTRWVLS